MTRILFVDDEEMVLRGIQRVLSRSDIEIDMATSAQAALDRMAEDEFDLIVTDLRMPGMDGVQLLERVKKDYPTTLRLVLSGHADEMAAVRAAGLAQRFLLKPCSMETLTAAVVRAQTVAAQLRDPRLRRSVARTSLPSIPRVYVELVREMKSPDVTADSVAKIVSGDPAIAAKLLQIVNSAFFASASQIRTIRDAVVRLGFRTIRNLAMAAGVFDRTGSVPADLMESLRSHSLEVAQLASAFGGSIEDRDEAFLAGLLHDLGVLVMIKARPESINDLRGPRDVARERIVYGISHDELGAYLLSLWGLPHPVVEAALHHHHPVVEPSPSGAAEKVYYAECLLREREPSAQFVEAIGEDTLARWHAAFEARKAA